MSQDYGSFTDSGGREWWIDGNGRGFKIWRHDGERIVISEPAEFHKFLAAVRHGAFDMFGILMEAPDAHIS